MNKGIRSIIKIIIVIVALALLAIWGVTTFFPHKLVPFVLRQQIQQLPDPADYLSDTDGIKVITVGTSSPIPGDRAQTGTAVFVNGHFFMFDVGPGVVAKSEQIGLPLTNLDGIFITHWHSDHFMDLPNIISRSWVLGRSEELHLYGPDGLDTLNHAINQFLHIENRHRVDHHTAAIMDISLAEAIPHEFHNVQGGKEVVYNQDGITITAFDVSHEPVEPAVGYAIEYKGKKVVISGDTKRNDLVQEMAKDADLLLHEILLQSLLEQMSDAVGEAGNKRNQIILKDIQDYHTWPKDVAELAQAANVKQLVLHHFVPPPDFQIIENLYKRELKAYKGPIHFADDGDVFVVE